MGNKLPMMEIVKGDGNNLSMMEVVKGDGNNFKILEEKESKNTAGDE